MNEQLTEDWFIKQIDNHQGIIHKICTLYACNKRDQKDLYQEILLQLWKSFHSFRGKSKFSTWMYRVALNTAITIQRKSRCEIPQEEITFSFSENYFEEKGIDEKEVLTLYNAIAKLKKIDKAIVMLYLDEKSYAEISEIVGITKSNVSVRIVRIKKQLEQILRNIEN